MTINKNKNMIEQFVDFAYDGNVDGMETLLPDVDINGRNVEGYSALYSAVFKQRVDAVDFLIKNGATIENDLIGMCFDDFTEDAEKISNILLKNGYKISQNDISDYLTPYKEDVWDRNVQNFIKSDYPDLVQDLINNGAKF